MGDSVANWLADIGACALGYALARRLPVWGSVALFVAVEVVLLLTIDDSLLENIVILVGPG